MGKRLHFNSIEDESVKSLIEKTQEKLKNKCIMSTLEN